MRLAQPHWLACIDCLFVAQVLCRCPSSPEGSWGLHDAISQRVISSKWLSLSVYLYAASIVAPASDYGQISPLPPPSTSLPPASEQTVSTLWKLSSWVCSVRDLEIRNEVQRCGKKCQHSMHQCSCVEGAITNVQSIVSLYSMHMEYGLLYTCISSILGWSGQLVQTYTCIYYTDARSIACLPDVDAGVLISMLILVMKGHPQFLITSTCEAGVLI